MGYSLQLIGMIFHRLATFGHLLAATSIDFFSKKKIPVTEEELIEKNATIVTRNLHKLSTTDDNISINSNNESKEVNQAPEFNTMTAAFRKRIQSLKPDQFC